MNALVIGGSSWDTLIHIDKFPVINGDNSVFAKNIFDSVGGTGAGKALALDSLGAKTTLITNLGNDVYGDNIKRVFSTTSINLVIVNSEHTDTHTNIMYNKGDRLSIFTRKTDNDSLIPSNINELIIESDVVFLNINNFCRQYIPLLKGFEGKVVVDIHDYDPPNEYHQDFIDAADIIFCSDVNITDNKEFLDELIKDGKEIAVLTSGSRGATVLKSGESTMSIKGLKDIDYVDSNGAGDSFCAGFMVSYFKDKDIGKALKIANVTGGLACESKELYNRKYGIKQIEEIAKKKSE